MSVPLTMILSMTTIVGAATVETFKMKKELPTAASTENSLEPRRYAEIGEDENLLNVPILIEVEGNAPIVARFVLHQQKGIGLEIGGEIFTIDEEKTLGSKGLHPASYISSVSKKGFSICFVSSALDKTEIVVPHEGFEEGVHTLKQTSKRWVKMPFNLTKNGRGKTLLFFAKNAGSFYMYFQGDNDIPIDTLAMAQ
ncbi:MAG: hypothetical protein Q7R81_05710 [Candidatus Peregrinibacteria bacterium]|nr:hypothetical protein [Candidatus Peregrinibacteria bacterium]